MVFSQFARKTAWCWLLALAMPAFVHAQLGFVTQGTEYPIAGTVAGDQVYPAVSVKPGGGFVVWQDNRTDGDGQGISALKLDSNFSAPLSSFRVNQQSAFDQSQACVSLLNDGGAVFVWAGGRQGMQHIFARFLSSSNTWLTGDVPISTFTNDAQINPSVATLTNGSVVIVWSSFNQQSATSMQDVYARQLSAAGQPQGNPFLVNLTTAYNQRSAAVAALSDGRYIVAWVSEQQRAAYPVIHETNGAPQTQINAPTVDIYARLFQASGTAASDEFLINGSSNICANPSVARSSDGGFIMAWMEKNSLNRNDGWDVFARPFSGAGFGGIGRRVNTQTYGDQGAPKISAVGSDYLVVWTSMGQDGSREGVYGQFLRSDGSLAGGEFRVNSTTISQQMHPTVASDGTGRFLAVWTSFVGGASSFDLFAQRFASTNQPLYAPDPPFVTVLSSNSLSLTWQVIGGYDIASYEIYGGSAVPPFATASVTNNMWTATDLSPSTTNYYRLAYVLADGRRSPLSGAMAGVTYSASPTWGGIPQEWMAHYFYGDIFAWPSPYIDSDGDGASNKEEFLAGTDPTDPNSVLRVRLQPTAQGLFLNWNTQSNLIYQVQASPNFTSWSNLGGLRFAPGSSDSMYVGGNGTGYYRVVRRR